MEEEGRRMGLRDSMVKEEAGEILSMRRTMEEGGHEPRNVGDFYLETGNIPQLIASKKVGISV